jgi:hypothetical protein
MQCLQVLVLALAFQTGQADNLSGAQLEAIGCEHHLTAGVRGDSRARGRRRTDLCLALDEMLAPGHQLDETA